MATIGYKIGRFQFQGGTKKELEASELILLENELALEVDEETGSVKMRRGDGKSKYADCPYIDIGMLAVDELTEEQIKMITGPRGEPGKDFTYDMFTAEQRLDLKGEPGDKGDPGKDGKSITVKSTSVDSKGATIVTFSDGKTVSIARGIQGEPGPKGADGVVTFESLTDDQRESIRGPEGKPGKTGSPGKNGNDGKSITIKSQSLNTTGDRVVVFSDGSSVTIPKGDKGAPGSPGKDGSDATVTAGTGLSKLGTTLSVNASYVATKTDLKSYAKSTDVPKMVTLTQAEYDGLSTKDSGTYYFIKE